MKKLLSAFLFFVAFTMNVSAQTNDTHTKIADQWPMFPGCENLEGTTSEIRECADQKLFDFISSNLEYPLMAKKLKIEGTVYIKLKVDEQGNISNAQITKEIGSGCGDAALKVVHNMIEKEIRWIPAKLNGVGVAMDFSIPFKFEL